MPQNTRFSAATIAAAVCLLSVIGAAAQQQGLTIREKQSDQQMLQDAKDAIEKHYYDAKFHGVDLNQAYAKSQAGIQASQSNHQAFTWVSAFVESLNDTHTRFEPPDRVGQVDYGYQLQMI